MQGVFKRKTVGILAAVGAVALFAGGGALGFALNSDEPTETVKRIYVPSNGQLPANESAGGGSNPAVSYPVIGPRINGDDEQSAADGGMAGRLSYPGPGNYGLCPVPIGDVATGSIVDITNSGFVMNLLGEGFELRGINIRSEGECGPNGEEPTTGFMVVDTNWVHTASGYDVYLSQRVSPDEQANVRYGESANFWADGYIYSVNVSNWVMYPMERSATDIAPPPAIDDPQVQAILDAAIGQLVPQIGAQCFFTLEKGSWGDLAGLGIGDPRPAMPSGYSESHSNIDRFVSPSADCPGADLEPTLQSGVYAGFTDESGGWIDISAWPQYENVTWPGYIDDSGASWSNGQWSYNVYGYGNNGGLGRTAIEAIARAMDPNFDDACFIQTNALTDPASVGLGTVTAPDGYTITNTRHTVTDAPSNCAVDVEGYPHYNLNWTVDNGDNTYDVNANHYPMPEGGVGGEEHGYISDWGMSWGTEGSYYSISAVSRGVTGVADREAMIAIAQSLDPSLDVSTLQEEKGGGMPRPLPVEPDGGIGDGAVAPDSSSSSSGATEPATAESN